MSLAVLEAVVCFSNTNPCIVSGFVAKLVVDRMEGGKNAEKRVKRGLRISMRREIAVRFFHLERLSLSEQSILSEDLSRKTKSEEGTSAGHSVFHVLMKGQTIDVCVYMCVNE